MSHDDPRYEAWLLTQLFHASQEALRRFPETHLGGAPVTAANLRLVQACLRELGRALRVDAAHTWRRVERAAEALGAVALEGEITMHDAERERDGVSALPFTGAQAAPPPLRSALEPNPMLGGTAPLTSSGRAGAAASLPFDGVSGPDAVVCVGTRSLTLEHYAELMAWRARYPAAWAERRDAYGIVDDESFAAFDRAWQARFVREPTLQRRWVTAFQRALEARRSTTR